MKTYIGIDVSKDTLDACLLHGEDKARHRKFTNGEAGYRELVAWVDKFAPSAERHFCMEATGSYSFGPASFLAGRELLVSVENPRRIKHFAIAANFKTKTDKVDAFCIALYAQKLAPKPWSLMDPTKREIVAMRKRIRQMSQDRMAEELRLEDKYLPEFARKQIEEHVSYLNEQVKQTQERVRSLMNACQEAKTIYHAVTGLNGVGPECGLLLSTLEVESFDEAKAVAAHFGLNPKQHQSGKFQGQTRISKQGDSAGRAILMSAANAAARANSVFKKLYDNLVARGLKHKQAVAAVARKIVMIAWAIARNALRKLPITYPGGEHRGKNLRIYCDQA